VNKGSSPQFSKIIVVDDTPQHIEQGRATHLSIGWVDFVRTSPSGIHLFGSGGLSAGDSRSEIHGAVTKVDSLASGTTNKVVRATSSGELYMVEPPQPAWSLSDSDSGPTAIYDLGSSIAPPETPWVPLTGLSITAGPTNVTVLGDRVDFMAKLFIRNKSTTVGGTIQIGISRNGGLDPVPGMWVSQYIPPGAIGVFPISLTSLDVNFTDGEVIGLKARISQSIGAAFGAVIDGNMGTTLDYFIESGKPAPAVSVAQVINALGGFLEVVGPRIGVGSARIGRSLITSGPGALQAISNVSWTIVNGFAIDGPSFGSIIPDFINSRIICNSYGIVEATLSIAGVVPNNQAVTFGIRHKRGVLVLQDKDIFTCIGTNQVEETGTGSWAFPVQAGDELIVIAKGGVLTSFTPHYLQLAASKLTN
jgi:hypothetical protein